MQLPEIKARLLANAVDHDLSDATVHVARGVGGRWRVRVVSNGLAGIPDEQRRLMLLTGIEDHVEDPEILTPVEEPWYGPPFSEVEGALPTWPDALGQHSDTPLLFASDLDEDLPPPAVVTFYSLRGGVGRTTALVAAAHILSSRGYGVLCVDMDFEAPGLSHLFGLPEPDLQYGALPLLLALESGEEADIRDHIQRVSEAEELYCLPAGRLGPEYAQRLRLVEPEHWYRESSNPLHIFLNLAARSSIAPDFILLDARTGISPISAPLLFDVSDLAVVCFFPHPQTRRGTELLVTSLLAARSQRSTEQRTISPEPRFLVSPVPPGPSAWRVRDRALSWVDQWLSSDQERRSPDVGQLQAEELTHFVTYSSETAFSDMLKPSPSNDETYGAVADWLEQLLPQAHRQEIGPPTSKRAALEELDFSTGTAEHQESLFQDFVRTKVFAQAMDRRYPLVVGRKGTGKTAVFRWLLERSEGLPPVPVMCPNALRSRYPWVLGADGFAAVERHMKHRKSGWSAFWSCYTALATYLSLPDSRRPPPPAEFGVNTDGLRTTDGFDELTTVDVVTRMLTNPDAGLLANRWLRQINSNIRESIFLLFDGLDTGFGNESASRDRRSHAVTGLFTFVTEAEAGLPRLPFKVLLRYDIWQSLRFENKSHLYGRSVQLLWRDQTDYFKTALKQAVRSESFKGMLCLAHVSPDVDSWLERDVFRAWNVLVGERMKGGKTTFTRNWVWNRLADGLGDHGPRALSQLFNTAVEWEKREEERSAYDRSVIRPRGLVPSLETVSTEAVQALREEFPELEGLIEALIVVGRTPLDPTDISAVSAAAIDQLDLALEVGLVAVHEGTQEDVRRYRVPDLYRHGLRMTRKGQA